MIDYYVIFEICLMASKSARMRGSAHLKAVTVAHGFSETVTATSLLSNPAFFVRRVSRLQACVENI